MTYGLRQAGINVIAGVDLDAGAKETYETNNPGTKFINADITKLPLSYFEKKLNIKPIFTDYRDGAIGINCLAISPGRVLTYDDAPWTAERLAKENIEVIPLNYKECRKKGGGIHCGTLPLIREE